MTNWIVGVLAAITLALAGCSKPPPPPPLTAEGVTIDLPKLMAAFPSAGPEIQTQLDETAFGLRYNDYNKSLAGLDKLANTPNLTEQQKKVISDVTAQVKKAVDAKAGAAR